MADNIVDSPVLVTETEEAITQRHIHANADSLNRIGGTTEPTWNNEPWPGGGDMPSQKGVAGYYKQVAGVPANEFEFNDLQEFLDKKINNKWFDGYVDIDIHFPGDDALRLYNIKTVGSASGFWLGFYVPYSHVMYFSNLFGDFGIWTMQPEVGQILHCFNVSSLTLSGDGVTSGLNMFGGLQIYDSTVQLQRAIFGNVTSYRSNIYAMMSGAPVSISILYQQGGHIFIGTGVDFNVDYIIELSGVVIDNRPNHPLDTFVRKTIEPSGLLGVFTSDGEQVFTSDGNAVYVEGVK